MSDKCKFCTTRFIVNFHLNTPSNLIQQNQVGGSGGGVGVGWGGGRRKENKERSELADGKSAILPTALRLLGVKLKQNEVRVLRYFF